MKIKGLLQFFDFETHRVHKQPLVLKDFAQCERRDVPFAELYLCDTCKN